MDGDEGDGDGDDEVGDQDADNFTGPSAFVLSEALLQVVKRVLDGGIPVTCSAGR